MLNDAKYRAILCLNGELPDAAFFQRDLPIIAADGAANRLEAINIMPDIIIGDLDSVHPALLAKCPSIHAPDQSFSDYQKCLTYLEEKQLLPAIIVGISGGHLDHILHNINIFSQTDCLFYAPPLIGLIVRENTSTEFTTSPGTKISLIGMPHATVSSQGLKWEVAHHALAFPGDNSCFNRAEAERVHLTVHSGNCLVLIYQTPMHDAGWK
jgi:thiamine pyrophosphokinase